LAAQKAAQEKAEAERKKREEEERRRKEEEAAAKIAEEKRLAEYSKVEEVVNREIKLLLLSAKKAKDEGRKKDALEIMARKKNVAAQLELLQQIRDHPSKPAAPTVNVEEVEKKIERVNQDVKPNEMYICVESMTGLVLAGYPQLNAYVYCEAKTTDEGVVTKIQSPAVGGSDPELKYETRIPIERTRATARYFERKKLIIQVWHHRGALIKDVLFGRFAVDLAPLVTKSQCEQDCPVLRVESKRPISPTASAHVELKLTKPLAGQDFVVVKERTIVFNPPLEMPKGVPAAKPAAAKPAAPQPAASQPAATKPAAAKPAPAAAKPAPAPAAKPAPSQSSADDLLEKTNDVARYVSQAVLQNEQQLTQAKIAQAKKNKQPIDDLEMRLDMIQDALSDLEMSVAIGTLTPEQYIGKLKKAIIEDKQLGKDLLRLGMKDEAIAAARRARLMENEIKEMEAEEE